MQHEPIAPCPFCAAPADWCVIEIPSGEAADKRYIGDYLRVFVRCRGCGASASPVDGKADDNGLPAHFVDDAIAKWNARAPI